ncbi:cupin domain-containing protein [Cognatishimia activa]|uniref:cupin domain-containing protein n=1 Tax=Cognatishimia activa TaxID=1715691 RepID=UPI002231E94C|nr:cupin domain-containing protein [Cognatishimia activa]UZD89776.1 cupin domain-containing protein [Cognatishimia activa]
MTRLNERILDTDLFKRRKATEDTKRKIAGWEIWECADPAFSYEYDRTVTMFVHEGAAVLSFSNGHKVDLQAGDTLTVQAGASADWVISSPIRNSYMYHDTFMSADNRAQQVRWEGEKD